MPWGDKNSKTKSYGRVNKENSKNNLNKSTVRNNNKKLTKSEQFWANAKKWIWYYRSNIHRLAIDAGVQLKDFQKILMFMMDRYPIFMWIASRGTGKSFLIMLYCICRAILYPKSQIVISSGTKGQAILMIQQYAKMFYNEYPFFRNEIEDISTNKQEPKVIFYNGSTIYAVTASDNSRGYRSNLLILEEFRMIKKEVLDSVLRKFGTTPRQPPYLSKPEYKHMRESNKEIYISSAWYQSHWSFQKMKGFWQKMREDGNNRYAVMSSDIELPIHEGLYDEEKLMEEKSELDNDPITWSMEMDSLWFGEGKSDIIKYSDFEKNRTVKKAVYPYSDSEFIGVPDGKKPKPMKYKNGSFGVLSVDLAISSKADSDNTIFHYFVVSENANGYKRELKYSESMNGKTHRDIDLRLKQLWYDFNISYIAIDAQTIGLPVLDELGSVTYDPLRDMDFPAMKSYNDEDYADRALDKNALSNLFTINGGAVLNDLMIRDISAILRAGKIKLLTNENEFRDMKIQQDDKYMLLSAEERVKQELPYVQTNLMIHESINLEITLQSGKLKVQEVGKNRKDRFSSLMYGNWLISILEHEMLKSRRSNDESNVWVEEY